MATLSEERIAELLAPYLATGSVSNGLYLQVSAFLDLLLLWNAKTNLTAVREPEALVQRQIGESLFAAQFVPSSGTLMDFGSGAGFPGIPLQMMHLDLAVTLAESQGKKTSFLREAVRTLGLKAAVWAKRVEDMPKDQQFDCVVMRAVDHSERMFSVASCRCAVGGSLVRYVGAEPQIVADGWDIVGRHAVPLSSGFLEVLRRAE